MYFNRLIFYYSFLMSLNYNLEKNKKCKLLRSTIKSLYYVKQYYKLLTNHFVPRIMSISVR